MRLLAGQWHKISSYVDDFPTLYCVKVLRCVCKSLASAMSLQGLWQMQNPLHDSSVAQRLFMEKDMRGIAPWQRAVKGIPKLPPFIPMPVDDLFKSTRALLIVQVSGRRYFALVENIGKECKLVGAWTQSRCLPVAVELGLLGVEVRLHAKDGVVCYESGAVQGTVQGCAGFY